VKLLFDQNLSFKLCEQLADLFPDSDQVRRLGMAEADDRAIWDYAKANGFAVVSQDSDFAEMAALLGPPPKVIWLRGGNQPTAAVGRRLRAYAGAICSF
jgi:predicted nuclease of predicted toxin-antitoxin system